MECFMFPPLELKLLGDGGTIKAFTGIKQVVVIRRPINPANSTETKESSLVTK